MFPLDQLTDRSNWFRIAEIIREKLTLELVEELPYGVAVEIERSRRRRTDARRSRPSSGWTAPARSRS